MSFSFRMGQQSGHGCLWLALPNGNTMLTPLVYSFFFISFLFLFFLMPNSHCVLSIDFRFLVWILDLKQMVWQLFKVIYVESTLQEPNSFMRSTLQLHDSYTLLSSFLNQVYITHQHGNSVQFLCPKRDPDQSFSNILSEEKYVFFTKTTRKKKKRNYQEYDILCVAMCKGTET